MGGPGQMETSALIRWGDRQRPWREISNSQPKRRQPLPTAAAVSLTQTRTGTKRKNSALNTWSVRFSSLAQLCPTLWPHGLQHARPPCPSPAPRPCSNSCLLSWWCHPNIASSVVPFSSHLQSFPSSGSFQMSQFFISGGQSIGVSASASVLPMNTQDWYPLGWTGWISLQSKGLSRVFSNTTVQKHQFFGAKLSLQYNSHILSSLLEKP